MVGLSYDLESYRNYLIMSNSKHILVEGSNDKRVFMLFIDELLHQSGSETAYSKIVVDTAEQLLDFEKSLGNRAKVETVCQRLIGQYCARKLVGFVDREFREFDRIPLVRDRIGAHKVCGRLVWSRGHSVENYYFDFETLRVPLRAFSVTDAFCDALDLFEKVFEQTIRLACAASLAGDELQKLRLVERSIEFSVFRFMPDAPEILTLDLDMWKEDLVKKHRLANTVAKDLIKHFRAWHDRVEHSEFCPVRWMCHGHIGLAFIWGVYGGCVHEICLRRGYDVEVAASEARRVLRAEKSVRFNLCAENWVRRALRDHCSYPQEVFRLLCDDNVAT